MNCADNVRELVLMRTLQGRTAVVEKKYVSGKSRQPTYTILADYPTVANAQYAINGFGK